MSRPSGGTGCFESSSWMTIPVPVNGMRPAAMRACWSLSLSWRTTAAEPSPWPSTTWICERRSRIRS